MATTTTTTEQKKKQKKLWFDNWKYYKNYIVQSQDDFQPLLNYGHRVLNLGYGLLLS